MLSLQHSKLLNGFKPSPCHSQAQPSDDNSTSLNQSFHIQRSGKDDAKSAKGTNQGKKRDYIIVSNKKRIQLIILIFELGLPCFQVAKMLKIPYTNAKAIYRGFKVERKVLSHKRSIPSQSFSLNHDDLNIEQLREESFQLLIQSIECGFFSEKIVNKLKMKNLRILLRMTNLDMQEARFDQTFPLTMSETGRPVRILPIPFSE